MSRSKNFSSSAFENTNHSQHQHYQDTWPVISNSIDEEWSDSPVRRVLDWPDDDNDDDDHHHHHHHRQEEEEKKLDFDRFSNDSNWSSYHQHHHHTNDSHRHYRQNHDHHPTHEIQPKQHYDYNEDRPTSSKPRTYRHADIMNSNNAAGSSISHHRHHDDGGVSEAFTHKSDDMTGTTAPISLSTTTTSAGLPTPAGGISATSATHTTTYKPYTRGLLSSSTSLLSGVSSAGGPATNSNRRNNSNSRAHSRRFDNSESSFQNHHCRRHDDNDNSPDGYATFVQQQKNSKHHHQNNDEAEMVPNARVAQHRTDEEEEVDGDRMMAAMVTPENDQSKPFLKARFSPYVPRKFQYDQDKQKARTSSSAPAAAGTTTTRSISPPPPSPTYHPTMANSDDAMFDYISSSFPSQIPQQDQAPPTSSSSRPPHQQQPQHIRSRQEQQQETRPQQEQEQLETRLQDQQDQQQLEMRAQEQQTVPQQQTHSNALIQDDSYFGDDADETSSPSSPRFQAHNHHHHHQQQQAEQRHLQESVPAVEASSDRKTNNINMENRLEQLERLMALNTNFQESVVQSLQNTQSELSQAQGTIRKLESELEYWKKTTQQFIQKQQKQHLEQQVQIQELSSETTTNGGSTKSIEQNNNNNNEEQQQNRQQQQQQQQMKQLLSVALEEFHRTELVHRKKLESSMKELKCYDNCAVTWKIRDFTNDMQRFKKRRWESQQFSLIGAGSSTFQLVLQVNNINKTTSKGSIANDDGENYDDHDEYVRQQQQRKISIYIAHAGNHNSGALNYFPMSLEGSSLSLIATPGGGSDRKTSFSSASTVSSIDNDIISTMDHTNSSCSINKAYGGVGWTNITTVHELHRRLILYKDRIEIRVNVRIKRPKKVNLSTSDSNRSILSNFFN